MRYLIFFSLFLFYRFRLDPKLTIILCTDTFPWWPAVVVGIDEPAVPPAAKKMYTSIKKKNKNLTLHFVRFYDKQHSW